MPEVRPLLTVEVLRLLRDSNADRSVTEHSIRSAIRRGQVPAPPQVSGTYLWGQKDVRRLADALGLLLPERAVSR